jgi:adenosylcobinamide kinase / adenosylcobinamide-phosphate guanylyltransferase
VRVRFEGTAGAAGWPEPGCPCASCARLPAGRRAPTRIVVDGRAVTGGQVVSGARRLLYAPDGAPDGFEPVGPFDLVVLGLDGAPERLAGFRRQGAVDESTDVVVVGIDHRVPSEEELARRLGFWGARAVPDGTVVDLDRPAPRRPPVPRRTLLLGGSRSGKSAEAELRLAAEPGVTYVATGPSGAGDGEWAARVRAHRVRRPPHWETLESTDLASVIARARTPLLIDGLGTWVAAVFDELGAWEGEREGVHARCDDLVEAWRRARVRVVAVSDEVGMGVVPATASGRAFRDALGRLNARLAAESESAALVVAGRVLPLL